MRCEHRRESDGDLCFGVAFWYVQVGRRKTDAQYSCGTHLNRVCLAMLGAENRRDVTITIRPARPLTAAG